MARQDATAAEIQKAVQDAVNAIPEVKEDRAQITIHEPQWHEDDDTGCNWSIPTYNGDRMYAPMVYRIIEEARTRYRLKD